HQRSPGVENLQRQIILGFGRQIVIEDGSLGRIFAGQPIFAGVVLAVVAPARCRLHGEKMGCPRPNSPGWKGSADWRQIVEDPARAAVGADDEIVVTNGRSCWILDDLTPIRTSLPAWGVGARAPHFFPVQSATRWRYHGENYAGEDRLPGENPPKGAILNYYLPAKPKDDLTLEIFDARGTLV